MRETGRGGGRRSHRVLRARHRRRRDGPRAAALLPRRLLLTARRMIGTELLDDPRADPLAVERELEDITRLNALFGGTRAVVEALEPLFQAGKREAGDGKRVTW